MTVPDETDKAPILGGEGGGLSWWTASELPACMAWRRVFEPTGS